MSEEEKPKKMAIIAAHGTLDAAYPPLILASTAAALDMEVQKSGRTTEYTTGRIIQVDVTSRVSYGPNKVATFVDQLMAGAMSQGGDSGSAVLSTDKKLVGLLFAGSTSTTIINPIQYVFDKLDVTLP